MGELMGGIAEGFGQGTAQLPETISRKKDRQQRKEEFKTSSDIAGRQISLAERQAATDEERAAELEAKKENTRYIKSLIQAGDTKAALDQLDLEERRASSDLRKRGLTAGTETAEAEALTKKAEAAAAGKRIDLTNQGMEADIAAKKAQAFDATQSAIARGQQLQLDREKFEAEQGRVEDEKEMALKAMDFQRHKFLVEQSNFYQNYRLNLARVSKEDEKFYAQLNQAAGATKDEYSRRVAESVAGQLAEQGVDLSSDEAVGQIGAAWEAHRALAGHVTGAMGRISNNRQDAAAVTSQAKATDALLNKLTLQLLNKEITPEEFQKQSEAAIERSMSAFDVIAPPPVEKPSPEGGPGEAIRKAKGDASDKVGGGMVKPVTPEARASQKMVSESIAKVRQMPLNAEDRKAIEGVRNSASLEEAHAALNAVQEGHWALSSEFGIVRLPWSHEVDTSSWKHVPVRKTFSNRTYLSDAIDWMAEPGNFDRARKAAIKAGAIRPADSLQDTEILSKILQHHMSFGFGLGLSEVM